MAERREAQILDAPYTPYLSRFGKVKELEPGQCIEFEIPKGDTREFKRLQSMTANTQRRLGIALHVRRHDDDVVRVYCSGFMER